MKTVYGVIYLLIDGTNDKEYVGQTTRTVEERFKEHANYNNSYIGNAIRAHGADMFVVAVLKECANKEELDFWERYLIRSRNTISPNGYNLTDGGDGSIPCDETRAKMSAAQKGRVFSAETRAKLSAALSGERNPHYGKKNTPEHQSKIVASNLGAKRTPETCARISAALTGKTFTAERCANISAAQRSDSPYKNLLRELDAHKLSFHRLAELLNLAQSIISRKMHCKRNFTARDRIRLEEIFGKPADYLLERSKEVTTKISVADRDDTPFKNLLYELDERKMTTLEFSKLLGVAQSSVSCKMHCKQNFTARDRIRLEEIFGKPADYLLERDDD